MSAIHPTITQALKGFIPTARPCSGDTAQIEFMGWTLFVEMDYQGAIEGILNAQGDEVIDVFNDHAISQIQHLANAEVVNEYRMNKVLS